MNVKFIRFLTTSAAIVLGVLLINAMTFLGDKTQGPLETLCVQASACITSVEGYFINRTAKGKRSNALKWLDAYRKNPSKLRNPKVTFLGAFDNETTESFQSVINLENKLETHFPILHIYSAWGDKPEQRFPLTQMKAIQELGSIPMVTWEPWLIDFDETKHEQLKDLEVRDKGGLRDIADGVYDFYLENWVNDLKLFGQPLFIRFGHEMNDPYRYSWGPQNNAPEDFIAAWKHVVDYFRAEGVDNVIWVWSPHIAYGLFEEYYPGDDYVDWVGVGTLNYGTVAIWSQWWTFDEIFGNHYEDIDKFNKPIMATEFGSLAVGGDRRLWYQEALCEMPEKYPSLKAVLFFHFHNDITLTNKALDWYISGDTLITNTIVKCFDTWPDSVLIN